MYINTQQFKIICNIRKNISYRQILFRNLSTKDYILNIFRKCQTWYANFFDLILSTNQILLLQFFWCFLQSKPNQKINVNSLKISLAEVLIIHLSLCVLNKKAALRITAKRLLCLKRISCYLYSFPFRNTRLIIGEV